MLFRDKMIRRLEALCGLDKAVGERDKLIVCGDSAFRIIPADGCYAQKVERYCLKCGDLWEACCCDH